ncbi:Protein ACCUMULATION AND REPLICATION OF CHLOROPLASTS 3 [Senna tora]|uniref:Protein ACCUMULATION AND REPLICATION OF CHLOROPLASTS 3 n=1 Tax=Senna tora TaxID=362788 RepID=A0A834TU46_9FABA|nr:Protein ACCUMULATION AND REPLICATION OF CHLOROPLASTS 3 [Senna tora]
MDAARTERTPCLFVAGSCCCSMESSKESFNSSEDLTPTGSLKMLTLSATGVASAAFSLAHSCANSYPGPRFQFTNVTFESFPFFSSTHQKHLYRALPISYNAVVENTLQLLWTYYHHPRSEDSVVTPKAPTGKFSHLYSNQSSSFFLLCSHRWFSVQALHWVTADIASSEYSTTQETISNDGNQTSVVLLPRHSQGLGYYHPHIPALILRFVIPSIDDTSSCRLNPSKVKGFKTIATVNPLDDFMALKISTAKVSSDPYPALAT